MPQFFDAAKVNFIHYMICRPLGLPYGTSLSSGRIAVWLHDVEPPILGWLDSNDRPIIRLDLVYDAIAIELDTRAQITVAAASDCSPVTFSQPYIQIGAIAYMLSCAKTEVW